MSIEQLKINTNLANSVESQLWDRIKRNERLLFSLLYMHPKLWEKHPRKHILDRLKPNAEFMLSIFNEHNLPKPIILLGE